MSNVQAATYGLSIAQANLSHPLIIVTPNENLADSVYQQLRFFSQGETDVYYLPDTETLPYDIDSPHSEIVSRRANVLGKLATGTLDSTLVVSANTLMRRIASREYWAQEVSVAIGDAIDIADFRSRLNDMGYAEKELEISDPGQYIIKNQVIDIFTCGQGLPCRIKTDKSGVVQSIARIDLTDQRSGKNIDTVSAFPAREFPSDDNAVQSFKNEFLKRFELGHQKSLYKSVRVKDFPHGIEYFLPLFGDTTTIIGLMERDVNATVVFLPGVEERLTSNWETVSSRYHDISLDKTRIALDPAELWVSRNDILSHIESDHIRLISEEEYVANVGISSQDSGVERQKSLQATVDSLRPIISKANKTLFCLYSVDRIPQAELICQMLGIEPDAVGSWEQFLESSHKVAVIISRIEHGFRLVDTGTVVISEKELFGNPIFDDEGASSEKGRSFEQIQDLQNLNIGDPIVHVEHGVGRFQGLEKMDINGRAQEFIAIEYDQDSRTFVNMDDLHLVSRYGGISVDNAPLDTMGSTVWRRNLHTAVDEIRNTAQALISLRAARTERVGIAMKKPRSGYYHFAQDFPFRETKDQMAAIRETIEDLISNRPMDRTVVGDVGFGKTEVAMRAAFVAADSGYQTAVMVPTMLLAQQHFNSFNSRFEQHGVKVAILTRQDKSEVRTILKGLKSGEIDIVVGTHRIMQQDVEFASLGLLVVDEEHRFGVSQKNMLSEIREGQNLNVLSLTATPIPRTLGLSLQGVRDLSVIATAPAKRLSIRTFTEKQDDRIIAEAINREMMRDGQVYYLHNRTEDIAECAERLREIAPDARIRFAHGQMDEYKLSQTMVDFLEHRFDILVCTTIIEIGIDIPNANTILIEDADRFGLAQLHQIRGRVGRSHHQGYAYLMTQDPEAVSASAKQRLETLKNASHLGDGFVIANHDLEIRGAGEILGEEQSGHIANIGFALYMRLLNNALDMIHRGMKPASVTDFEATLSCEIGLSGIIDSSYITSDRMRLSLYKRFSGLRNAEGMSAIKEEMEDRFGPIPENTNNLLMLSELRCYLRELGVKKVNADDSSMLVEVRDNPMIRMDMMIDMVNQNSQGFRLLSPEKFQLTLPMPTVKSRISVLKGVMNEITHPLASSRLAS